MANKATENRRAQRVLKNALRDEHGHAIRFKTSKDAENHARTLGFSTSIVPLDNGEYTLTRLSKS